MDSGDVGVGDDEDDGVGDDEGDGVEDGDDRDDDKSDGDRFSCSSFSLTKWLSLSFLLVV